MSYKLTYFKDFRGRGEPIRLVLHAAGQKFEDFTIDYEKDWAGLKSSYPMAQLPVLEINGDVYAQHFAITRHLARKYGFAGKNATEEFHADVISDICSDIFMKILEIYFSKEENKAELTKKFKDEFLPMTLKYLASLQEKYGGNSGYFVGSDLTWADMIFYDYIETAFAFSDKNILDDFPSLIANRKKTEEHPKLKDYIANRTYSSI